MKSTTYGRLGGSGPTAGKRAHVFEATFPAGFTHRVRTFKPGPVWLMLIENERGDRHVDRYWSLDRARQALGRVDGDTWPVQLIAEGRVAGG